MAQPIDWCMQPLGLYLHIPFCKVKCVYCDFYSIPGRESSIPVFTTELIKEIDLTLAELDVADRSIGSIFFGGGTPSLMPVSSMDRILSHLRDRFQIQPDAEISMEANPGETSPQQLRNLRELGVNRISVGIQSLRTHHLKFMSRIHDPHQARQALGWIREAGFSNFNADLIFALPGQTIEEWVEDLVAVMAFEPTHLATYSLTVEEGTALERWVSAGHVQVMEEVEDLAQYNAALDLVRENGYDTYEISNHAKPGFQCAHNLGYWQGREYLSFGPSAHSYFGGRRWWNHRSLDAYLKALESNRLPQTDSEVLDEVTRRRDYVMTRLRLKEGFQREDFESSFGQDFVDVFQSAIRKWSPEYLHVGERVALTRAGMAVANEIITDLM